MIEYRKYLIQLIFILTGVVFLVKLFSIQVTNKTFAKAATENIVMPVIEYPFRGLIYDRNGYLIVYNDPQYDIQVIPKEVKVGDTTSISELFQISTAEFNHRITNAKRYSYVKPSPFVKMVSNEEFGAERFAATTNLQ